MVSPKSLVAPTLLSNSPSALYTVPEGKVAIIQRVTLCNSGSGTPNTNVYLGDGAGTAQIVLSNKQLTANQTYAADELKGHVLAAGESIWATSDIGGNVNFRVSGVEVDVS